MLRGVGTLRFTLRDSWHLCCVAHTGGQSIKQVSYPPLPWSQMEGLLAVAEENALPGFRWEAVEAGDLGWWIGRAPEPETVAAEFVETKLIEGDDA